MRLRLLRAAPRQQSQWKVGRCEILKLSCTQGKRIQLDRASTDFGQQIPAYQR
jgi:hypothetical protein